MKTKKYHLILFLIIIISGFSIYGCQKDNTNIDNQTQQSDEEELHYYDENIIVMGDELIKDTQESIYEFFDNETEKFVKGENRYYYFKIYEDFNTLQAVVVENDKLEINNDEFSGTLEFYDAHVVPGTKNFIGKYRSEEFKTK